MPRQKLSEYRAKKILTKALNLPYQGWSINGDQPLPEQLKNIGSGSYVVKVDEGVKGRFKKGLVLLGVAADGLENAVIQLKDKGYSHFIIEPQAEHEQNDERYLSLASSRVGILLRYSSAGGVNIEQQADQVKQVLMTKDVNWQELSEETGFSADQLKKLLEQFQANYFVFLEINPYLVSNNELQLLDAAVEVDDAGEFFVNNWRAEDFRRFSSQQLTPQELVVQELDANSPASLKLIVLEPNGSIFLLLSGGGASVVVADEIYNQGYGKQLANYGEYSGNPNSEETYAYTKAVLELLLNSTAPKKVVFIGGAVANFTDIAKTFAGVIKAIDEVADQLKSQHVKVFVRRGGPNQEKGLAQLEKALAGYDLLGAVHSPDTPLPTAVSEALQEVAHD